MTYSTLRQQADVVWSGTIDGTEYRVVRRPGAGDYQPEVKSTVLNDFWDIGTRFGSALEAEADAKDHAASMRQAKEFRRTVLTPRVDGIKRYTPWGATQHAESYGPGVTFHSTASHGGFFVERAVLATMPAHLRNSDGWYEEDCESAKVVLGLPHLFTAREQRDAQRTWDDWLSPEGRARHEADMAKWQASVRAART